MQFPLLGSASLFGLYMAFKYLDPATVNLLIGGYFGMVGCAALTASGMPVLEAVLKGTEDSAPDIREGSIALLAALVRSCGADAMRAPLASLDEKRRKRVEALAVIDHNIGATQSGFPVTLCGHYFCDQRFVVLITWWIWARLKTLCLSSKTKAGAHWPDAVAGGAC